MPQVSSLKCYQTNGTVAYSATNPNASLGVLLDCPSDALTCSKNSTDTTMVRGCSTNFCTINGARVNISGLSCVKDAAKVESCCCYDTGCNSTLSSRSFFSSFKIAVAASFSVILLLSFHSYL